MGLDERQVQKNLTSWIRSQTNSHVFWSEDVGDDIDTYTFTGKGRPDMLSMNANGLNVIYEVKDGSDSAGVYDAMVQLQDYWRQYEFDNVDVSVNEQIVEIDTFVIATQYSPKGHLFCYNESGTTNATSDDREKGFRQTYTKPYEGRRSSGPDIRPQFSFARTESIPPILYRYAWDVAEENQGRDRSNIDTGIGVLLSDSLDSLPVRKSTPHTPVPKIQWYNGEIGAQWTPINANKR